MVDGTTDASGGSCGHLFMPRPSECMTLHRDVAWRTKYTRLAVPQCTWWTQGGGGGGRETLHPILVTVRDEGGEATRVGSVGMRVGRRGGGVHLLGGTGFDRVPRGQAERARLAWARFTGRRPAIAFDGLQERLRAAASRTCEILSGQLGC